MNNIRVEVVYTEGYQKRYTEAVASICRKKEQKKEHSHVRNVPEKETGGTK